MQKDLVSVVTPCYNTGKYIHRLLDSILFQTYPHIEMFVIDDGSTDNSKIIIESYISKFNKKGYSLKYIYQDNSGQSVALQKGLDLCSGEFFVWPDSDDFYASSESIEKMVLALQKYNSDEIGMVRTQNRIVDELTMRELRVQGLETNEVEQKCLFEDCLFGKNRFYFCAGAYMVRLEQLKKITLLPIYTEKNAGQNWQIMLPILWNYQCVTIKEVLYTVVSRSESHSRGQYQGFEQLRRKYQAYYNTIIATLNRMLGMQEEEKDKYRNLIYQKYGTIELSLCVNYYEEEEFRKKYVELNNKEVLLPIRYSVLNVLSNVGLFKFGCFFIKIAKFF